MLISFLIAVTKYLTASKVRRGYFDLKHYDHGGEDMEALAQADHSDWEALDAARLQGGLPSQLSTPSLFAVRLHYLS